MAISVEVFRQDVVIPAGDSPIAADSTPKVLTNDNVGQPDFQALVETKTFPKSAVIFQERAFEPLPSVSPPPPEPAPWTASARGWLEWVNKRDSYLLFMEHRALDEEALIGTF